MDLDDAYANATHIPGAEAYPPRWAAEAEAYRKRLGVTGKARLGLMYGHGTRQALDLFLPDTPPRGLVVFVHGGYWLRFDRSFWSHLAKGSVDSGYAVAMPSYDLCPEVSIAQITAQIGAAITAAAAQVEGPIVLSGHSAGGHLVTAMMCEDSPLPEGVRARLAHVVSISGLHDLRPLMRTARNSALRLDRASAEAAGWTIGQDGMEITP